MSTLGRDIADGLSWMVAVIPAAVGFWLVAGNLAGVRGSDEPRLLAASLLAMGLAILGQVLLGYRTPMFEGPAGAYLAAIAVVVAERTATSPAEITTGTLLGGAVAVAMGLTGAHRWLRALLTPAVATAFLLITVATVLPAAASRALDLSGTTPFGRWPAVAATMTVLVCAEAASRRQALKPYSLLLALGAGTLAYLAVVGHVPRPEPVAWGLPHLLPWGAPRFEVAILGPFVLAGLLGSFNAIATAQAVMPADAEADSRPGRRGLVAHGASVIVGGLLGSVLANVPRLDSVGIVQVIGNRGLRPLMVAACGTMAVACCPPAIALVASVPASVPASLALVVLISMLRSGSGAIRALPSVQRRYVLVPALLPAVVWLLLGGLLPAWSSLLTNPLAAGVVLAVVADRCVRP